MSKFKTVDQDQRKQQMKSLGKKGLSYVKEGIDVFIPQDGQNAVRIIPPLAGDKDATLWGIEVWTYFLSNRVVLSNKTFDSDAHDPVAERFFSLRENDPEKAEDYKGVKRFMMWIIDIDDEEKVKLWPAPPTLVETIIGLAKDRKSGELIPIESPTEGRIIYFDKVGQRLNTKYVSVEVSSEVYELDDSVADEMMLFKEALIVPTKDELEGLMNFEGPASEEVQPRTRRRRGVEEKKEEEKPVEKEEEKPVENEEEGDIRRRVRRRLQK